MMTFLFWKNLIVKFLPYIIAIALILGLVFGSYYKGRSDKSNEIELDNAKARIVLMEKINKIEEFSHSAATAAREDTGNIQVKLDAVLAKRLGKVVVTPDCKPNSDFAGTWNQINEVLKNEKSPNSSTK